PKWSTPRTPGTAAAAAGDAAWAGALAREAVAGPSARTAAARNTIPAVRLRIDPSSFVATTLSLAARSGKTRRTRAPLRDGSIGGWERRPRRTNLEASTTTE